MPPHDRTATRPAPDVEPRQVLLFSGHRVDAPERPQPRFPPGKVAAAARRIDEALAHWQAGPQDLRDHAGLRRAATCSSPTPARSAACRCS